MSLRQSKTGYFVLEGLNSFATSFYFYYLFFFMQRQFAFGNRENLTLAAVNGAIYTVFAWLAGKFGQRFGYEKALLAGFGTMSAALLAGVAVQSTWGQVAVMVVWTVGICFTWPNLEALVSEKETPAGLQRMIGIYNLVWAGAGALAYFSGGILLEQLGLRSLFWVPLIFHLAQIGLLQWLRGRRAAPSAPKTGQEMGSAQLNPRPIARVRLFLRMAWLANPFAYVAINTVVAVVPGLAQELNLGPAQAGIFCSIWFFARMGTFLWLWLWTGWHYRAGWFLGAYVLLVGSYALILLVPQWLVILLAQITFGMALGLIYYSSLYYSMDVSETKGEHGGLHEAAIGVGLCVGPAIGAAALHFFPGSPHSGAWAVSVALCGGLAGLVSLAVRRR